MVLSPTPAAVPPVLLQVGDVHGCYDALLNLLDEVQYTPLVDNLILVGDLVDKGPKSQQVGAWSACMLSAIGQKPAGQQCTHNAACVAVKTSSAFNYWP